FVIWFWAAYGMLSVLARRRGREILTRTDTGNRGTVVAALGVPIALALIAVGAKEMRATGRDLRPREYRSEPVQAYQIKPTREEAVLWRMEAFPDRPLTELHYGIVPEGFRQVIPASGAPRPLRRDEYTVSELFLNDFTYESWGRALDERRVAPGVMMSSRRKFPRGLSRDQMRAALDRAFPAGTEMRGIRSHMEHEAFACRDWS